jgi:hypothetical protein
VKCIFYELQKCCQSINFASHISIKIMVPLAFFGSHGGGIDVECGTMATLVLLDYLFMFEVKQMG